jgi:hypothetical protein
VGSRSRARARAQASQLTAAASQLPRKQPHKEPAAAPPAAQESAHESGPAEAAPAGPGQLPRTVRIAAVVQAVEAAGVLAASLIAGVDALTGQSYHRASGIAITLIGIATAVALAYVARGLNRGRRWSRTPAMLTHLFIGIVGIYLIQAPRLDWGIPAIVLAIAGLGSLLAPASIELLTPGRAGKS